MNYQTLLNCHKQTLHHGPPRETYDRCGERTIQFVKPVLRGMGTQKTGKCMASHLATRNAQTLVDVMIEKFDKHIQSEHGVNLFKNDKLRSSGSVFEVRVHQDCNEVVRQ